MVVDNVLMVHHVCCRRCLASRRRRCPASASGCGPSVHLKSSLISTGQRLNRLIFLLLINYITCTTVIIWWSFSSDELSMYSLYSSSNNMIKIAAMIGKCRIDYSLMILSNIKYKMADIGVWWWTRGHAGKNRTLQGRLWRPSATSP